MLGEVEVKARAHDLQALAKRALDIGGVFVCEVSQEDIYFRHPNMDLKDRDEALRLRQEGNSALLTFKGRKVGADAKMREEIEVSVSSFSEASAILKRLGFTEGSMVRKKRRIYKVGDVIVSLDAVESLGDFVEVEAKAASASIETENGVHILEDAKAKVFDVVDRLGIPREKLSTASYLELLDSASSSSMAER